MGEKKLHYKMYKDGKKFVFAAIATLSFFVFGGVSTVAVHADTTLGNLTAPTVNSTSDTKSAASSAATVASSASDTKSAAQSAATVASSASDTKSAAQSATTAVSSASDTKSAAQSATTAVSSASDTKSAAQSAATAVSSASDTKSAAQSAATAASSASDTKSVVQLMADNATTTAAAGDSTKTDNTATTAAAGDNTKTDNIMASSAANNNLPNSTTVQVSYQNLLTQLSSSSELNADSEALTKVTKDNFEKYFSLNGSAAYDRTTGIVTITPDENNKDGNFSLESKIDMNTNFTLTGQINLGNRTSSQGGADGIGFAFHTGNTTDIGNAGANLGIGGLQEAIGFKLDTYHNDYRTPQANEDGAQVASTDSNGYGWDTDPDGTKFPQFGAFVNTSQKLVQAQDGNSYSRWWATTDMMSSVQELNSGDLDGQFHDFVVSYDGSNRKLTINYTETGGNVLTWTSTSIPDAYQAMAMVVSASTGANTNLQQFKISSFDFKQAATVNVKYVDQKGNQLDQGTVSYPSGADVNGNYDTTRLDIPNYTFIKMSDSAITGGNSLPASGTLKNPGDNGTVIYVYAPAYSTTMKTVNETINYVNQNGETVSASHTATPINFLTVTNPVTKETTTYYKNGTQKQPTLDVDGQPDSTWTESNEANFQAVTNPTVPGYHVIKTTGPTNDLTQTTSKTVDITNGNLNYTVTYTPNAEKANVTYIDDTTGKKLSTKDLTGNYGTTDSYQTGNTIKNYENQGYKLVSDGYPATGVEYNEDGIVKNYEVHLVHVITPINPSNPAKPGTPINPDEPNGPKWPEGTDKSSVTQTVIRTVNYLDKQTGKVVAKQITEQVTYNRTAIVDKVTGQIIDYSTTGGDTVDQTDGDKAWTAVDNKSDWDSVTSPDLSSKGYLAPDLATVAQQTVTPGDKDVTVNVYYDHDVVPVNPTNPQTPGKPINPDDPDSPKWPAGTDKNSLTTDVHQTIHYQYGDGSQAAPDKTDSTTFDHQVEIDKVTGEIVKDDGWTAENGKTSFDSKNSPVIPGYTASKPASDSVDGLTQDSKDNVQTIIYTSNQEAANVTYIDDKTGKTLSAKDLTGDYGSTDSYRTGDTIADYEKQGYQLVSDNYPTHGVVYNQDGTVQSFEVHLTQGTTPVGPNNPQTPGEPINPDNPDGPKWPEGTDKSSVTQTVIRTVNYLDKQTGKVVAKQITEQVTYNRTAIVDKVTGQIIGYSTTGGDTVDQTDGDKAWTAVDNKSDWDSVTSPDLSSKGYLAPDLATVAQQTVTPGDKDVTVNVYYDHDVVPVNPTNPQTPGTPINPDDPDSPKWPAGTDKNSLTTDVHQTIHYQYGDGSTDPYRTGDTIADYEKQGYQLVSDNYPTNGVVYNQDGTVQSFEVHLTHGTTPVGPNNSQTPGEPINPDGPKWPEGTDKSSVTQTVIRTVNYLDKQTGKVVAKQVTEQVTYNRTAIVDKVTGQIIGYSTTGGDTVDQTDGDKAWTAVDNKSDWDSVTSPDLSSKGYLAPDLATVAQQTVTPGDKDVTVNVYYDHDVVPVNPTNPQTPGTPINPDDPDSPKWPAGTDKNSLTTDVHQTIHYQYGDGSQAAPDKTDSTTFDHQVEIDKVTGEIVKDDGWTAENGKTSFDSKNSPVIPGYTASKPASDSVDGLTQDSKDNVQTIVYAKTPVAGGNVTAKYVDENGNPIADDVIASGNVGDPYSTTQKDVPGYTFKEVQGNPTGSFTDQDQTVTYVYTKNPATDNNGGTGSNQPGKPGNGTDTGNPSSNQPGNPSQPSNATNNGVINTSTNTGSKVNNGAVNSPELPQTGENNSQSQTMSFIGILLAMFGSLLGFLGIKKRRND
ncbi:hypothetical protein AYR56_12725 (plasmid) [Loigolactobacillus backii]|uniref:Gram-positive cocci surface proteins LPxTG domain-containing protein n=1 Tax=Loigolactobacillus backii TaxID=375175 RepID=A0A192H685_9LACO|nr:MucBP domain-containing protein [Loigolactobacillus backii]ANK63712.1 hypothetical protein AYR53_12920 [Loigolactobacillus backii]ANK71059.1 hypothetical protein AYR56_12725 [Loigolactobacillus backii]